MKKRKLKAIIIEQSETIAKKDKQIRELQERLKNNGELLAIEITNIMSKNLYGKKDIDG